MVMEESDMELASESIPVPQVQESVVDTLKRNNKSGASRGKPRLRKKALHALILKQMEFYFSDANLSKDRYLSGLLKESSYVDLEVFTRCNKLRELTTDTHRIAKALQGSTMLKVSEDGTKVCRLTPIRKKENIDQCTIYVQNLPPDADHEWLMSIFSKYGTVEYISIPRYTSNRKIKGFAFVEFDMPSSAQECIKMFRKKGRVLPSHISPNELLSITTFDEPKKDVAVGVVALKAKTKLKENEKASGDETGSKNNVCEVDTGASNSKQSFKRRKYSSDKSFVADESDIKVKRKKREATDQSVTTDQQDERGKTLKTESEDNICDNEISAADSGRQSSKKRKYSSEKVFATDEGDIKVRKKKKVPKEDFEDNDSEINAVDNNDRQGTTKKGKHVSEKSLVTDENDVKIKKRRKESADETVTDQQNEKEKVSKEELENEVGTCEIDATNDNSRQSARKRKFAPEKSCIKGEKEVTGHGSTENQEISGKSRNKTTEKKKRRLTVDDTIVAEDINGEEECQEPTSSSENKMAELEYEGDESNEANALLQTERHSPGDFGTRNSDIEETSVDERKKKKNRKKRSKIQNADICSKIGLQVMAKPDWKRLRNRYLDLQRYKMSQLKLHLRRAEQERGGIMTKNGRYHDKPDQNNASHDKSKPENDNGKFNEENKSCGRVNYASGIIVKIEMDEPCTDPQSFKMELKDDNSVKYVDVTADSCEAYVRYDTAEAAQTFAQKSCEGRRLTVLEGDEEKLYWDKISEDRMDKLSKKKRIKQRGRDKLLKRAEKELGKCIKFEQD